LGKRKKDKLKITDEEFKKLTKLSSNYIITDLQSLLKGSLFQEDKFSITPENFAELICLVYENKINSSAGQKILEIMYEKGGDPTNIMQEEGLEQMDNEKELEDIVKNILNKNKDQVKQYKEGKTTVLQYFVGQTMAATKGKANPQKIPEIIKKLLN